MNAVEKSSAPVSGPTLIAMPWWGAWKVTPEVQNAVCMMVAITNTGAHTVNKTQIISISFETVCPTTLLSPVLPLTINFITSDMTKYYPLTFAVNCDRSQVSQGTLQVVCSGDATAGNDAGYVITPMTPAASITIAQPALTQAEAIQIAASFCEKIGKPVTALGTAEFPVPNIFHWQPGWKVVFGDQAEVQVIDATRIVAYYNDSPSSWGLPPKTDVPAGPAISEATATRLAHTALLATGQTEQLSSKVTVHPADPNFRTMEVYFDRCFKDIPFAHDGAQITLYAETGAVQAVYLHYVTPPVDDVSTAITQQQAQTIAQNQLSNAELQYWMLGGSELQILVPDTYWQNTMADANPRVAWVVYYWHGDPSKDNYYVIWVDANNGAVVGHKFCSYKPWFSRPS